MIIRCPSCGSSFRLNPFLLKDFKGARVSCRRCGASIVTMNPLIPAPTSTTRRNREPISVAPPISPPEMESWTPPQNTESVYGRPDGEADSDHELRERRKISPHETSIRGKHIGMEEKFKKWMGGPSRISSQFMPPGTDTLHQPEKDFGEKITEGAFAVSRNFCPEPIDISQVLVSTPSFSSNVSFPGKKGIPNPMKSPMPVTLKKEFVLESPSEVLPLENRFQWWTDIALVLLICLFAGPFGYLLASAIKIILKLGQG